MRSAPSMVLATLLVALPSVQVLAQSQEPTTTDGVSADGSAAQVQSLSYEQWAAQFDESLDKRTGSIPIEAAQATLEVPDSFYFLDAADARRVLEEAWGNPPDNSTLGMLLPAGLSPLDEQSWAVAISFDDDGYVSDEDAGKIDYDELLDTMQADTRDESEYRVEQGYEPIELIGWAADPRYDERARKLYWAKELAFGTADQVQNTLNYNIRVLGRRGVLVLNFIAGMHQKSLIEQRLDAVLAMAEFDTGATYADFDPDLDTVAAYGIGGLIAGKVLLKTGLLAGALIFVKKFGVVLVIAALAFGRRFFSKKTGPGVDEN